MHNQSQIATCNSSQETGFLPYIKLVQKYRKKEAVIFFYQQHMIWSYQHQRDITIAATMWYHNTSISMWYDPVGNNVISQYQHWYVISHISISIHYTISISLWYHTVSIGMQYHTISIGIWYHTISNNIWHYPYMWYHPISVNEVWYHDIRQQTIRDILLSQSVQTQTWLLTHDYCQQQTCRAWHTYRRNSRQSTWCGRDCPWPGRLQTPPRPSPHR